MTDNKEYFIDEVYKPKRKNICIECGSPMIVSEHLSNPVSCSNRDCYNYYSGD